MPHSDEAGVEEERLVLRAVAALVVFVLAAGVGLLAQRIDAGEDGPGPATTEEEPSVSGGPLAGADVPSYVTSRSDALDRSSGRLVAVVSFDGYRAEAAARALVRGAEVRALLVAAPGGSPATVTGGLEAWARAERSNVETERENLVRLVATTEDPAFAALYREDIARFDALLQRLDPRGPVVFGAVVEGDVEALRRVAARGGVRLVDVVGGGGVSDDDVERLAGIRPEETARIGEPPTRPL